MANRIPQRGSTGWRLYWANRRMLDELKKTQVVLARLRAAPEQGVDRGRDMGEACDRLSEAVAAFERAHARPYL